MTDDDHEYVCVECGEFMKPYERSFYGDECADCRAAMIGYEDDGKPEQDTSEHGESSGPHHHSSL